jgi:hypothetical protein
MYATLCGEPPNKQFFVFTVEKGPPEEILTIFWG